jgi:hypothetical protein
MLPPAVRAHLARRHDLGCGFLTRGGRTGRRPCARSAPEKPLGHSVVQALPLAAPPADAPVVRPPGPLPLAGLWTPAVRLVQQPCCGPTTAQRQLSRRLDQRPVDRAAHGPAHDFPGLYVHQYRQISPARLCPAVRAVPRPGVLGPGHLTLTGSPLLGHGSFRQFLRR